MHKQPLCLVEHHQREGYKFIGWTPTVSEGFVEGGYDLYTAQWEKSPQIIEPVTPPTQPNQK